MKKWVPGLKRPWLAIVLLAFCILPILAVTLPPAAKASPTPVSFDVKVGHVVEIREGGLLIINDTVKLSTKPSENVELGNYTLGFPYTYQSNLDYAFAYATSDPNSKLKLELDVGMGRIGFYGVNVVFPQTVSISDGAPYEFTVVFVFSNSILPTVNMYNASFPAYPSLTQSASEANLAIVFPIGFNYTQSSFQDEGVNFTTTVTGSKQYFNYLKTNLTEFSEQQGWFAITKAGSTLELLEVNEVKRDIEFAGLEQMSVTDSYRIVRRDDKLDKIKVTLPKEAADISAFDVFGLIPATNLTIEQRSAHTNVAIKFTFPYDQDKEALFSVHYQLPWKNYVSTESWNDFHVSLTLFENFNWTIRKLITTIVLPEGATLTSSTLSAGLDSVQSSAFTSSLTFVFQNATPFQTFPFDFKYGRSVFWESYHPTLWMGSLVIVIGAIVSVWRFARPIAAPLPTAMIGIRAEDLKSFVDLYDEKRRLQREIESLETQARKGKIPRPRYKARKMTIESRLASLSRDLKALEEKIRLAGPRYTDLMRQIEVAETALEGVEADISRTGVRYRRGEISPAAYNKLLEDAYRRRDRALTTIDGVLLRLREETI